MRHAGLLVALLTIVGCASVPVTLVAPAEPLQLWPSHLEVLESQIHLIWWIPAELEVREFVMPRVHLGKIGLWIDRRPRWAQPSYPSSPDVTKHMFPKEEPQVVVPPLSEIEKIRGELQKMQIQVVELGKRLEESRRIETQVADLGKRLEKLEKKITSALNRGMLGLIVLVALFALAFLWSTFVRDRQTRRRQAPRRDFEFEVAEEAREEALRMSQHRSSPHLRLVPPSKRRM